MEISSSERLRKIMATWDYIHFGFQMAYICAHSGQRIHWFQHNSRRQHLDTPYEKITEEKHKKNTFKFSNILLFLGSFEEK